MARYDRAITVFSPDGHLFQVEYALEAVRKGSLAVGVRGSDSIVLVTEEKAVAKLAVSSTVRKIAEIDDGLVLAFAGLTADARVLIDRARVEAASHRLTLDEPAGVEYVTRHIAALQQRYTQSGGVRPFGISTLVAGFDAKDEPALFQTDPSGTYSAWRAAAIGRNSKAVLEFLEKNALKATAGRDTLKLAFRALSEVVDATPDNVEVAVVTKEKGITLLSRDERKSVLDELEAEKAAATARAPTQTADE